MAFSGVLPRVVADTPLGGNVFGGYNAVTQAGLQNKLLGAQANLAQQQANWTPYQYQMQALSSPFLWMAAQGNPDMQKNLMNMMSGLSGAAGQTQNQNPLGNGLVGMLYNKISGNSQPSNNAVSQMPQIGSMGGGAMPSSSGNAFLNPPAAAGNGNVPGNVSSAGGSDATGAAPAPVGNTTGVSPVVPATGGPMQGATASMTAQYNREPNPAGSLIPDPQNPGHVIATPNAETIATSERSLLESQSLRPIIKELSDGAAKWLAPGAEGRAKLGLKINHAQQLFGDFGNIPSTVLKQIGISEDDLSDYANWKADQGKAVNSIMQARDWPKDMVSQETVGQIMSPLPGEGRGYGPRVVHDLAQLDAQVQNYKNALRAGVTSAPLSIQYPGSTQSVAAGTGAGAGVNAEVNQPPAKQAPAKQAAAPAANQAPAVYGEGKEPPANSIWMKTPDGKGVVPVHNTQIKNAKALGLTEIG